MNPQDELPEHLKAMTEMLEKSLHPPEGEPIPPLPDDLRDKLRGQYGRVVQEQATVKQPSFWATLGHLFAKPAFSGALAALVLLGVIGSLALSHRSGNDNAEDNMRGAGPSAARGQASVILYQVEPALGDELLGAGFFDRDLVKTAATAEELEKLIAEPGTSIIIDGTTSEIRSEAGETRPLPASPSEIAETVGSLQN